MEHHSLYFIAIVPPLEIKNEIQKITENISLKYNTTKALSSEPHITIIPPFWYPNAKVDHLKSTVSELRKETFPFNIKLNGYDTFPSRVLYINVQKSDELQECYERAHAYLPKDTGDKIKRYKQYHPHITIAFKDISQENFLAANIEYQDELFEKDFELEEINLYKHNGKKWLRVKI